MARSLISLKLFKIAYTVLKAFAQTIHDGFVALAADYPTPNPVVAVFQTDIDALDKAITKWGIKGNRGSHADHVALIAAANVVRNDLRMLAAYAVNTKPDDPGSWTDLGFTIKRPKSKPDPIGVVQNFRQVIEPKIPLGQIKFRWKRPLDTDAGDVKGYFIQFNNLPVQPAIDGTRGITNVLLITPNTVSIITPPYDGANYFWVTPFNTVGYGVSSDVLSYNAPVKP